MTHTLVNYESVEPKAPGMHFLRDSLSLEELGFTVVDVDAGWEGMAHGHAESGHEEVYYLVEGAVTVDVDGEAVGLDPGDALRVDPAATRQVRAETDSQVVIAGAP